MSEQLNLKKIETEAAFQKDGYDTWYGRNKTAQHKSAVASRRLERGVIENLSGESFFYPHGEGLQEELAQLGNTAMEAVVSEHYLQYSEKKAGEHYQENEDSYRELALIDAHKEGAVINVEQPLEIGQKIDVHTTQPPVHTTQPPVHTTLQPLLRRW